MDYNIGVLISGDGSNLNAIINNGINVKFVVSNNHNARGLLIAKKNNIPVYTFKNLLILEEEVSKLILHYNTELLVLAGFMKILSRKFIHSLPHNSIINLHPSLLPAFQGKNAIIHALDYGVKYTGITIHYVDEGIDTGMIIDQKILSINKDDTFNTLQARIKIIEHNLYPLTIKRLLDKKRN
ncbi:phosphoribosylglycinamide formyltransferase [Alphaproteobacteria bacterium]|nr:phosphoribosylglycinamide formyltransferase [Alphaproteobacteria bacterium]